MLPQEFVSIIITLRRTRIKYGFKFNSKVSAKQGKDNGNKDPLVYLAFMTMKPEVLSGQPVKF